MAQSDQSTSGGQALAIIHTHKKDHDTRNAYKE